jgi:glycosyltransferase involved in cell wall biosynthesis
MNINKLKAKLQIESYFIYPFALLGKLIARIYKLKTKHGLFLLYPNTDIGGSTRVNIELAKCLRNKHPLIIFTKKPKNNLFHQKFSDLNITTIDLHKLIDIKSFHFINFIFRGIISEWAKQSKIEAIIGGENIYFYKIIPFLEENVRRIEITHVDAWINYSIGFHDLIDYRVFSTENLKNKVELQYRNCKMNVTKLEKLKFIENGIAFKKISSTHNDRMQVFFIGRGSAQKRVHLAVAIAEIIHQLDFPIDFNFVGKVNNVIDIDKYPYCKFYGDVYDDSLMNKI